MVCQVVSSNKAEVLMGLDAVRCDADSALLCLASGIQAYFCFNFCCSSD